MNAETPNDPNLARRQIIAIAILVVIVASGALLLFAKLNLSGMLDNSSAESAIRQAFSAADVTVQKIQEMPATNEAVADVLVRDFPYNMRNGQHLPPYSEPAVAGFVHYNTGWVLKHFWFAPTGGYEGDERVSFTADQAVR